MTRRSIVLGLAGLPLFGGLLTLTGCGSGGGGAGEGPPKSAEERNDMLKGSADYMRKQYASKGKKK